MSLAFGRVLREQPLTRGLSQEALAMEAGVDRTFVSQLERGVREPPTNTKPLELGVKNCLGGRPFSIHGIRNLNAVDSLLEVFRECLH